MGFLIAPGLPAILLYLLGLLFVADWEAAWGPSILAILAYLGALIIGVPVHFVLQRKGINGYMAYLILGSVIGLTIYTLFFLIWALFSWQSYPEHTIILLKDSVKSGVISVVYAAISSTVFWLITVRT